MNTYRKVYVESKRCGFLCVENVIGISENRPQGKGETTKQICAHTFHVRRYISWHIFHLFLISFLPHNVKLEATARLMLWFANMRKMRHYSTNHLYPFQMPCKNSMRVASKNKFPFFRILCVFFVPDFCNKTVCEHCERQNSECDRVLHSKVQKLEECFRRWKKLIYHRWFVFWKEFILFPIVNIIARSSSDNPFWNAQNFFSTVFLYSKVLWKRAMDYKMHWRRKNHTKGAHGMETIIVWSIWFWKQNTFHIRNKLRHWEKQNSSLAERTIKHISKSSTESVTKINWLFHSIFRHPVRSCALVFSSFFLDDFHVFVLCAHNKLHNIGHF